MRLKSHVNITGRAGGSKRSCGGFQDSRPGTVNCNICITPMPTFLGYFYWECRDNVPMEYICIYYIYIYIYKYVSTFQGDVMTELRDLFATRVVLYRNETSILPTIQGANEDSSMENDDSSVENWWIFCQFSASWWVGGLNGREWISFITLTC